MFVAICTTSLLAADAKTDEIYDTWHMVELQEPIDSKPTPADAKLFFVFKKDRSVTLYGDHLPTGKLEGMIRQGRC
ncbi:MAG: hypothetical protein CMO80_08655 [Verrucomicrobiales bacterium]|nr:hypothetical protein [Verrucomicrobiales bacterium]